MGTVRAMGGSPLVGWVRSRRLSERPPGAEAIRAARDAMLGRARDTVSFFHPYIKTLGLEQKKDGSAAPRG